MIIAKEQVESAILQAQHDLDQALAELAKMPAFDPTSVAFAAHAMNNFLTVTDGTVELILKHIEGRSDAQLRTWLDAVQHATNLMTRIVNQLMCASAATEATMRFEKIDLPLLVQRVCNYYQRFAQPKKLRINVVAAKDVPPVKSDRVAVAAILDNLLSNAVKFSPSQKQIWVHVKSQPGWAICEVRDEGPGLSHDDQAKLFERGAKLTPKPTAGEISTGFGLAVAKELIEKVGGNIWCESVLGNGCCFSFRLPEFRE